MDQEKTLIISILDRSGSMVSVRGEVIKGFNSFLEEQLALPGECYMTLVQFDTEYDVLHEMAELKCIPPRSRDNFVPRGMTALNDAVGKSITSAKASIAAMPENEKPGLVTVLIFTDGLENASMEYHTTQVRRLIQECKEDQNWHFVYLGANVDAFGEAKKLGIDRSTVSGYRGKRSEEAYTGASALVSRMRESTRTGGTQAAAETAKKGFSRSERRSMNKNN